MRNYTSFTLMFEDNKTAHLALGGCQAWIFGGTVVNGMY